MKYADEGAALLKGAAKSGDEAVDVVKNTIKTDFIVTPRGTVISTNQDFNLVSTIKATDNGGEYLQIHNQHIHDNLVNPHTHKPQINSNPKTGIVSSKRVSVETSAEDIDYADEALKNGSLRVRLGRKDKGGY